MAFKEVDPLTGKRRRSGGRQAGTPNRTTSARYAAMARVNEALAAIGEDALTGIKLLREVLNHKDTPLDVKIQCAGLLTRHEQIEAADHKYVAEMPAVMPGETREQQLAIWWALHGATDSDDPEWTAACKHVLELAATRKPPGGIQ
jgi:hypothetical protein